MDPRTVLEKALEFHGHRCWASVAGVRVGLAALEKLGVKRSGGTQLYGIVEIGEEHGGMCFGDGVQYATGCTFGKGNIRKNPLGKLGFTLIEKDTNRAVRVVFTSKLQKQIAASRFMQQRAAGISPDDIPLEDQMELVELVWNAPEEEVLKIGEIFEYSGNWLPEVMGFKPCDRCGELTALAYLRVDGQQLVCIPCSGYGR
ncbi:FmdE family protein [Bellilinea sp.]|mgnify:FL=1|uniref:Formylmethanofuran dehydrogenase n=1 Tax=Bellilinea caldifistulae TaxID=360411 RepID=A0A7C4Q5C5_9CHLR|nr:FmdE family protein [Bellilinea sp.]